MTLPSPAVAGWLALALYNLNAMLGGELFRLRPTGGGHVLLGSGLFIAACVFFAVAVPYSLGRSAWRSRGGADAPSAPATRRRAIVGAALGAVVLLFDALVRGAGIGFWLNSPLGFLSLALSYCFILPVAFNLYFLAAPERGRGLRFGAAVGVAMLCRTAVVSALAVDGDGVLSLAAQETLFAVSRYVAIALFVALAVGYAGVFTRPEAPPALAEPERAAGCGGCGAVVRILAASAVFHVTNGFLAARLCPLIDSRLDIGFLPLPLAVAAACPAAGWLMDRDAGRGLRALMPLCALAMMAAPAMLALDRPLVTYKVIQTLGAAAQFTVFVTTTVAVAAIVPEDRWWRCLAICGPFIARFFSLPGKALSGGEAPRDGLAALVMLSILFAALFYHLADGIRVGEAEADPGAGEEPPAGAPGHAGEYERHGLTAREREVAECILRGLSTAEMAGRLAISAHTVNTHAKSILRKFGVPSRMAFVARMAGGQRPGGGEEAGGTGGGETVDEFRVAPKSGGDGGFDRERL